MSRIAIISYLLLANIFWASSDVLPSASAADPNPSGAVAETSRFAPWIQQLDSDRFADRREASRRLEEAGKAAFPALVEAALGPSREASLRALEILRKQNQEGNEAGRKSARAALETIAASDHAAARSAKEALKPPKPAERTPPLVPLVQGWPIAGQQVQVQVQVQMNAGGGNVRRRIQIRNGTKQIEVTENDLKVKITEEANGGVQMEVTRKKDGKETTEKYAAKSREDLKKAQPEAYRLYDKYAQQQDARIQIQAVPGAPPRVQVLPVPPR